MLLFCILSPGIPKLLMYMDSQLVISSVLPSICHVLIFLCPDKVPSLYVVGNLERKIYETILVKFMCFGVLSSCQVKSTLEVRWYFRKLSRSSVVQKWNSQTYLQIG